ncbi:GHMP kinase [Spirochaetia bacterium]|nr:GHMP kinase [Spirochaetia bacterium]
MIITRTPFRISLCGGGSDLPAFYRKHGGCVISSGINKYMYISIHPTFQQGETVLKYSKTEIVNNLEDIEHIYYKSILKKHGVSGVEITSMADIPAGSGLGSSSSFAVGLLHCLYAYKSKYIAKETLADEACQIEIIDLQQPIGKQDQYAASYGGLNFYTFQKDDSVTVEPIIMSTEVLERLQQNLMLFFAGGIRSASVILQKQRENIKNEKESMAQRKICDLAYSLREHLQNNNIDALGAILHESWILKQSLAENISNRRINAFYESGISNGALGGKLLGAGGGGFLLLYVPKEKQMKVQNALDLPRQSFKFDKQGSSVIYVGDIY